MPECEPSLRQRNGYDEFGQKPIHSTTSVAHSSRMANPWMKKNPWLSLWLSGANSMLGSARAAWLREAHRQNEAFLKETRQQIAAFRLGPSTPARSKKRRR